MQRGHRGAWLRPRHTLRASSGGGTGEWGSGGPGALRGSGWGWHRATCHLSMGTKGFHVSPLRGWVGILLAHPSPRRPGRGSVAPLPAQGARPWHQPQISVGPCKSGAGQDGSHHPCGFPEGLEPSVTTLGLCVCCLTANWWLSVHTLSLCLGRWHLPPPGILPQQRSRYIGPMDDGGTGTHHFWLSAWMEEGCPSAQGSGSCQGAAPGKGTPVAQLWDLRAQQ